MLKLIIGNRAYSSWSMRGWLAVKQSGVAFEELVVPMFDEEWDKRARGRRVRPVARQGADPVGRRDAWSGTAWRSSNSSPTGSAASASGPTDDAARGMARSMAAEMHSGFANLRRELPMNVRKSYPPRELVGRGQGRHRPDPAICGPRPARASAAPANSCSAIGARPTSCTRRW